MRYAAVFFLLTLLAANPVMGQNVANQETIEDFTYVKQVDEMTDEETHAAVTPSKPDFNGGLQLACIKNNLVFRIKVMKASSKMKLAGEGNVQVRYRFDDNDPSESEKWPYSTQIDATEKTSSDGLENIIEPAKKAKNMKFRISKVDGFEVDTYTFSMMGVTEVLNRLPCYEG